MERHRYLCSGGGATACQRFPAENSRFPGEKCSRTHEIAGELRQGAQNYLPPPPESKIELWVPESTVDTQILEDTGKLYLP